MDNAPDRIWAWKTPEGKEQWYDSICHWMGVGAVEYVRADLASPIGAVAMREAAIAAIDLDRAALDRPKVRALVEALIDISNGQTPFSNATVRRLCGKARAALAALEASHD